MGYVILSLLVVLFALAFVCTFITSAYHKDQSDFWYGRLVEANAMRKRLQNFLFKLRGTKKSLGLQLDAAVKDTDNLMDRLTKVGKERIAEQAEAERVIKFWIAQNDYDNNVIHGMFRCLQEVGAVIGATTEQSQTPGELNEVAGNLIRERNSLRGTGALLASSAQSNDRLRRERDDARRDRDLSYDKNLALIQHKDALIGEQLGKICRLSDTIKEQDIRLKRQARELKRLRNGSKLINNAARQVKKMITHNIRHGKVRA